jgi:hypothetical protein
MSTTSVLDVTPLPVMVLGNQRTGQDAGYAEIDRYSPVSQTIAILVDRRSSFAVAPPRTAA